MSKKRKALFKELFIYYLIKFHINHVGSIITERGYMICSKTRILTWAIWLPHMFSTTVWQTLAKISLIPFSLPGYKRRLLFPYFSTVWSYPIEVWPIEGELEWQMPLLDLAPNIPHPFFLVFSLLLSSLNTEQQRTGGGPGRWWCNKMKGPGASG